MNTTKNTKRLPWLDRVKGIGILLVVIGHVYVEDGFISRIIHGLNVPLFFLGAGYLSAYKQEGTKNLRQLFIKKVRAILVPYFLYSAAVMLWLCVRLFVFGYGSYAEMLHCLADIFCLEGISSLWFLSVLFLGELLYLFCGKRAEGGRKKAVTVAAFFAAAFLLTRFLDNAGELQELLIGKVMLKFTRILTRAVMASGLMLLGDLLYFGEKQFTRKHAGNPPFEKYTQTTLKTAIAALICLLISFAGLWYNGLRDFHYLSFGNFPLYISNALFGFITAACIGYLLEKDRILVFFGQNSLWIMATHLILLDFINIMAVLLSAPAGRYLGDALSAKLAAVMAGELFLLWGKKKNHPKNNPKT